MIIVVLDDDCSAPFLTVDISVADVVAFFVVCAADVIVLWTMVLLVRAVAKFEGEVT